MAATTRLFLRRGLHYSPPPIVTDAKVVVDLDDVSKLFKSVSTPKLLRSSINLHMVSMPPPIVDLGMFLMGSSSPPLIRATVLGVIRHTLFQHFVAGESPVEAGRTVEKMWTSAGMRGMLDYALEHVHDNPSSCDRNLDAFLHTVDTTRELPQSSVSFVVVKITAICPTRLLKRVSDLLRWKHKHPSSSSSSSFQLPWQLNTLPIFCDSSPLYHTLQQPQSLTLQEENELKEGLDRFHKLCESCLEANVPLCVDAEDTILQPAIDYFTYSSAIKYNNNTKAKGSQYPLIFGTIQAYLKDANERLYFTVNAARKMGVTLGFKLVRGAYMSSEARIASSLGFESPVHNTIQDTHDCYNSCANFMLDNVSQGWGALVLATHNAESAKMAARKAHEMGIKGNKLEFAQLYGMADALSFGLRNAGLNVSKYMPFGELEMVMPYLIRRAEENRTLLSSSSNLLDRTLMGKELKRRLGDTLSKRLSGFGSRYQKYIN